MCRDAKRWEKKKVVNAAAAFILEVVSSLFASSCQLIIIIIYMTAVDFLSNAPSRCRPDAMMFVSIQYICVYRGNYGQVWFGLVWLVCYGLVWQLMGVGSGGDDLDHYVWQ